MSVKRLILDTGQVDQDRIIGTGTVVLNSRAVLDTNIISGTGYNSALGYDNNVTFYDGSSIIYDFAEATLNGLTASVQSTPQVVVTAIAELGAIASSAQAGVAHFAQSTTNLGSLTNQISAAVTHFSNAQSALNGLQATATSSVKQLPMASSAFGSITAQAEATVTPVTPPTPYSGGGTPNYRRKKPQFIDVVEEPVIVEKTINQIFASSENIFGSFSAKAQSNIQWSILEDDAEILLLL
jgi:hypothetical protein